jgi:hypothetical protein
MGLSWNDMAHGRTWQNFNASTNDVTGRVMHNFEDGTDANNLTAFGAAMCQSFVPTGDIPVQHVSFSLRDTSGAGTGTMQAAIFQDNQSDAPSITAVSGLDTSDFSTVAVSDLSTGFTWEDFSVTTPVTLSKDVRYWAVVNHSSPDGNVDVEFDNNGQTVTPYMYTGLSPTSGWTVSANDYMNFRIYRRVGARIFSISVTGTTSADAHVRVVNGSNFSGTDAIEVKAQSASAGGVDRTRQVHFEPNGVLLENGFSIEEVIAGLNMGIVIYQETE